jgi:hypothetical protein
VPGLPAPAPDAGAEDGGVAGSETGALCSTADVLREERMARAREVNMKRMAATVVALDRTVAAPRLPKAVWLPPPPKAPARSAPFPVCRSTTKIKMRHTTQ